MGVSVESADYLHRVDVLRQTSAKTKFLSIEPLLGPIYAVKVPYLNLSGIDWVIVGGESGAGARPMSLKWARDIRDACKQQGVAFFMKQTGSVVAKEQGYKSRKGDDMSEWPEDLQIREFPLDVRERMVAK